VSPTSPLHPLTRSLCYGEISDSATYGAGTVKNKMKTASPMGMLMRKTKRQPNKEVIKPPREGPIARPAEILIALIPKALPRSVGGKEAVIMA